MKRTKFYSGLMRGILAAVLAVGSVAASHAKTVDVGYASTTQDMVYQYTGFIANEDVKFYAAALFTPEMMSTYAGGSIVGLRIGWCDYTVQSGDMEIFVREGLNAENVATAKGNLKFGWNTIMFDTPYQIPAEPGNIVVGCNFDAKAGTFNIATSVLGNKPANSCWITSDFVRHDNGEYEWAELSQDYDAALIVAIIDVNDEVNDRAEITKVIAPEIFKQGDTGSGQFTITNRGTNPVQKVTLLYETGGKSESFDINISSPIAANSSSKISAPVPAIATGETTVTISHVNGKENLFKGQKTLPVLAVPEDVAAKYTRRPLLEYYGSEGSHYNVSYYDDYFLGAYADYEDRMTIVCHHANDQFMTRDDEDTQMLVDFADGNKSAVQIPCMTLDRSLQCSNYLTFSDNTVAYTILYPTPYQTSVYDEALAVPTFADLSVYTGLVTGKPEISILVNGHVEPGVLPAGEKLKLTVYLLENNVASTSQNWATEDEETTYGGVYNHQNVIRQQPVPMWGVELDGDGDFSKQFNVEYDPEEWKLYDMRVVALLHRSETNSRFSRQVINCAESDYLASISEITLDDATGRQRIYNLSGVEVTNSNLTPGIYVVSNGKTASKIFVK